MEHNIILADGNTETLTILEGKALELKPPAKIKIEGDIETVREFLTVRTAVSPGEGLQTLDPKKAIITTDKDNLTIQLELDPNDFYGTEIIAKLLFNPDFLQFHINEAKTFRREELIKLLRFSRRFFPDRDRFDALLNAYQSLNISAAAEIKAKTDTRGNKDLSFVKTVNSANIPTEFVLEMPIFKGQPIERFMVEICLESTEQSVVFWFESVDLAELIEVRKQEAFNTQLEDFKGRYVIVSK